MERYELIDDRSRKFWQWAVDGGELVVEFGRIGSAGQRKLKSFSTAAEAQEAAGVLVREKLAKGYARVDLAATPSPIAGPPAETLTPTQVAMILIEHIEKAPSATLRPPDPERAAFIARWPSTPRTLVELWDFCGGEETSLLFVIARAAMSSFPAREKTGSRLGYISDMTLVNPGTVLWDETHAPSSDPRIKKSWVQLTDWGNDCLFVDPEGVVRVWSRNIDYPVVKVHDSFDEWMRETACALRDGIVRVVPGSLSPAPGDPPGADGAGEPVGDRVIRGSLSYEVGSHMWWDAKRKCLCLP